jgi:hypothetical protein
MAIMIRESLIPREKYAGPAVPVLNLQVSSDSADRERVENRGRTQDTRQDIHVGRKPYEEHLVPPSVEAFFCWYRCDADPSNK